MPPGTCGSPGRDSSSPVATKAMRGACGAPVTSATSPPAISATSREAEPLAAGDQHIACLEIEPGRADVAVEFGGLLDDDGAAACFGVFLDDDGIAPSGTTPPVKMRTASPAPTLPSKG